MIDGDGGSTTLPLEAECERSPNSCSVGALNEEGEWGPSKLTAFSLAGPARSKDGAS